MSLLKPNYGRRGPPRNEHLYRLRVWHEQGHFRATLRDLKGPDAYYFTDVRSLIAYLIEVRIKDYEKDLTEGIIVEECPTMENI
ncbi:MAG: hypothetical protein AAF267_06500 [Deinococcota bacterium]